MAEKKKAPSKKNPSPAARAKRNRSIIENPTVHLHRAKRKTAAAKKEYGYISMHPDDFLKRHKVYKAAQKNEASLERRVLKKYPHKAMKTLKPIKAKKK